MGISITALLGSIGSDARLCIHDDGNNLTSFNIINTESTATTIKLIQTACTHQPFCSCLYKEIGVHSLLTE